ncbi:Anion exchange protein 3 [Desmophyllum pertusum]|uniref:Anion exchange protein 3 n=1 Tax=Desmophyllum pertusum TaxID=174260 RepID=A0A9W9ZEU8_9CNID|nr:Anion exchange protein 3 [Desmophyllum pertusum]
MVITDQLSQTDSNKVLAALLLRHRHQHQLSPIARRPSSYNLLAMARKDSKPSMVADDSEHGIVEPGEGDIVDDGTIRLKIDDSADDMNVQEISQLPLTDVKQEPKQEVSFAPEPPVVEGGGETKNLT